jgi:hypothetical protein
VRDGVPALAADGPGGILVAVTVADEQDEGGPCDLGGGCDTGTAEAAEFAPLGGGEPAERVLLGPWHAGSSR